jgi:hypothetical protein
LPYTHHFKPWSLPDGGLTLTVGDISLKISSEGKRGDMLLTIDAPRDIPINRDAKPPTSQNPNTLRK